MTLFTFLCFASVVYLCAVADPIAETPVASSDQERLDRFMAAVEKSYDEEIASILAGLSESDRDCIKATTLNGVGGFMNYCMYRAREQNDEPSCNAIEGDDVIVQFDSQDPFSPAVAYKEPPVPPQTK